MKGEVVTGRGIQRVRGREGDGLIGSRGRRGWGWQRGPAEKWSESGMGKCGKSEEGMLGMCERGSTQASTRLRLACHQPEGTSIMSPGDAICS